MVARNPKSRSAERRCHGATPEAVRPLVALALALVAGACSEPSGETDAAPAAPAQPAWQRPDAPSTVVLVVVDALRRDELGAYRADARTPHFDRWTQSGLALDRAFSAAPWTVPSMGALFTGLHPRDLWPDPDRRVGRDDRLRPEAPTLAEAFAAAGWRTACLVDSPVLRAGQGFQRGFEWRRDCWNRGRQERLPGIGLSPAELGAELEELLSACTDAGTPEPLFLWIHLFHPHGPYGDPRTMPPLTSECLPELRARYRADVLESDACLGVLDAALTAHGRADALRIVTADHGEEFGEHEGLFLHGGSFYNTLVHVPAILVWPEVIPPGSRLQTMVRHVDWLPTLCEWLDLPLPTDLRGRSFVHDLDAPPTELLVALSQMLFDGPQSGACWQDGKNKIGFPVLGGPVFAYDLESDPGEERNLFDANELESHWSPLLRWLRQHAPEDPLPSARAWDAAPPPSEPQPSLRETLRALGYLDAPPPPAGG